MRPVDVRSGVARPRGRPARYSFDDVLETVVQVFNERGYEATSMEGLARATGMTKSGFYNHVSGKEQLLGLAVNRALDALALVLGEPGTRQGRPVERLEHVLRRTAEVLVAELPYVTLLLRLRGNTEVEREAMYRRREFDAKVAAIVAEAAAAGEIRADVDPRLATRLLFGMVNSVTEWYRPAAGADPGTDVGTAVVELALDALRAGR
jgi:AcrR family transcriptional regulator